MVKDGEKIVSKVHSEDKDIAHLIEATNRLVGRMDKFLDLFEESAKHLSEVETTEAKVTALATKLEILLDQNKAIAQGLLLLEKYVRGKTGLSSSQPTQMSQYQ